MSRLLSQEPTQPLGHPRAAHVVVLSADREMGVELLTEGTLRVEPTPGLKVAMALSVDGQLVSVATSGGAKALRELLRAALPEELLLLAEVSGGVLIATVVRAIERRPHRPVTLLSTDPQQQVEERPGGRVLLRNRARGGSLLRVSSEGVSFGLRITPGATPFETALELRDAVATAFIVLVTIPDRRGGDVEVTVLPRH